MSKERKGLAVCAEHVLCADDFIDLLPVNMAQCNLYRKW